MQEEIQSPGGFQVSVVEMTNTGKKRRWEEGGKRRKCYQRGGQKGGERGKGK